VEDVAVQDVAVQDVAVQDVAVGVGVDVGLQVGVGGVGCNRGGTVFVDALVSGLRRFAWPSSAFRAQEAATGPFARALPVGPAGSASTLHPTASAASANAPFPAAAAHTFGTDSLRLDDDQDPLASESWAQELPTVGALAWATSKAPPPPLPSFLALPTPRAHRTSSPPLPWLRPVWPPQDTQPAQHPL